jgi:carbonic anhydrase
MIETLIEGVSRFRKGYFNKNREKYIDLVENGQRPHTLLIACADSRVMPHAITHSNPGDIFVLRNIGNMVPSCSSKESCSSTGSAIEYATSVLEVSEIVVCGHSHCGACAALFSRQDQGGELALTEKWLQQGKPVRDLVLKEAATEFDQVTPIFRSRGEEQQLLRATEKAMVVQHLANLMTYDSVARRVADGTLRLHGWHYTIETGCIECYDPQRLAFLPIDHHHSQLARRRA